MTITTRAALAAATLSAIAAAGCAQAPKSIQASYVSDSKYDHWGCDGLKHEYWQIAPRLEADMHTQQHRRNWDIVTAALIGITPTLLNPDNERETEIAMLKGDKAAIEVQAVKINCVLDDRPASMQPLAVAAAARKTSTSYPLDR